MAWFQEMPQSLQSEDPRFFLYPTIDYATAYPATAYTESYPTAEYSNTHPNLASVDLLHSYALQMGGYPKQGAFNDGFYVDWGTGLQFYEDYGSQNIVVTETEGQSFERFSGEYLPPPEIFLRTGDDGLSSKREEYTFPATDTVEVDPPGACNIDDFPGATSTNTISSTKKRKSAMIEDLEDWGSLGADSDNEYEYGSDFGRTKVGRESSKTYRGGAKQPAKRVGSSSKANMSTVDQHNLRRSDSTAKSSSNDVTPGSKRRPIKRRKVAEETAESGLEEEGKCRPQDQDPSSIGVEYWQQPKPAITVTEQSNITPERNEMRGVDAIDDSAGTEDSDGDFDPGDWSATKKPRVQQTKRRSTRSRRRHLEQNFFYGVDRPTDEGQGSLLRISGEIIQLVNGKYRCKCGKLTKSRGDMKRHLESLQHQTKNYECPNCFLTFTRKDSLKRHMGSAHKL